MNFRLTKFSRHIKFTILRMSFTTSQEVFDIFPTLNLYDFMVNLNRAELNELEHNIWTWKWLMS